MKFPANQQNIQGDFFTEKDKMFDGIMKLADGIN